MRVVLYSSHDMEPITIIDLPIDIYKLLQTRGRAKIAVMETFAVFMNQGPEETVHRYQPKIVDIYAELIVMRGETHLLLLTPSEEAALMLRSSFLPGQLKDVNEMKRQAYARGFLKAIQTLR